MGAKKSENGWDSAFSQQADQDTSQELGEQDQVRVKGLEVQRRVQVRVSRKEVAIEVKKKEVDIKVSREEVDIKVAKEEVDIKVCKEAVDTRVNSSAQKRCRVPCEAEAKVIFQEASITVSTQEGRDSAFRQSEIIIETGRRKKVAIPQEDYSQERCHTSAQEKEKQERRQV